MRVARQEGQLSERRASGLIGINRGSWLYQRRNTGVGRGAATLWISTLASDAAAREVDGESKRVYRLYREEGLAMRRRKGKRFRAEARVPFALPARANQMWTMDCNRESLASGRKFRTLILMDGYTREAFCIEVDTSLLGPRVVQILERVAEERGLPEAIQVDNGPEFISRVVDQ